MYPLLLVLALLPSASALVDCRTACRKCREKNEDPSILKVYCSMCEECKERRRELLRDTAKAVESKEDIVVKDAPRSTYYPSYPGYLPPMMYPPVPIVPAIPNGCPMLLPCDSSEEVTTTPKIQKLTGIETTTITTTTTTAITSTTTIPRTKPCCLANMPCRNKLRLEQPLVPFYQSLINIPMPYFNAVRECSNMSASEEMSNGDQDKADPNKMHGIGTPTTESTTVTTAGNLEDPEYMDCSLMSKEEEGALKLKCFAPTTTQKDFTYIYLGISKDSKNMK